MTADCMQCSLRDKTSDNESVLRVIKKGIPCITPVMIVTSQTKEI